MYYFYISSIHHYIVRTSYFYYCQYIQDILYNRLHIDPLLFSFNRQYINIKSKGWICMCSIYQIQHMLHMIHYILCIHHPICNIHQYNLCILKQNLNSQCKWNHKVYIFVIFRLICKKLF